MSVLKKTSVQYLIMNVSIYNYEYKYINYNYIRQQKLMFKIPEVL